MRSKNICKFVSEEYSEKLEVQSFVCETDISIMKQEQCMQNHRAILVRKGVGVFIISGKEYSFIKGSLIFVFESETFKTNCSDDCEYMYITFKGLRSEELFRRFSISPSNRIFHSFDGIIPLWFDSLSGASPENIDLASESILLYTFSRLTANKSAQNDIVNKIKEITETEFNNPELSISFIADHLTYNSKYLSHIFKDKTGVSYTEYLRTTRIKYAITLLDHGIDSVKSIAILSGFSDPLYFSTVFKKIIGVSPKEYQQRLK